MVDRRSCAEPELRFFLFDKLIGVPTLGQYLWTLLGMWMVGLPVVARLLSRRGMRRTQHAVERWWARCVVRHLRIRLDVAGLEHVDPNERYIVAALHEGFGDVLALLHLPLDLRFVARDELYEWRVLGPYLRDTGQINVSPEQGSRGYRRLLRAAQGVFAAGESLVIFPQGTILGIETGFMPGAFALARAVRRPLLPVALTGSHRVWEHPYTPRLRYGQRISMHVLPPLSVEHLLQHDPEVVRAEVQRRLKAAALHRSMAPPRRFVPDRDGYWEDYAYTIDPQFAELAAAVERRREQRRATGLKGFDDQIG